MKPKNPSLSRATYVIDLDVNSRELKFSATRTIDGVESSAINVYNLDVIPFEMAMSQITQILVPKSQNYVR